MSIGRYIAVSLAAGVYLNLIGWTGNALMLGGRGMRSMRLLPYPSRRPAIATRAGTPWCAATAGRGYSPLAHAPSAKPSSATSGYHPITAA